MAEKEGEETEIYKNFTGRNYTCAQTCSLRVWAKELRGGAWRIVKSNLMSVMGFQVFVALGIQQTQIQRPCDTASALERDPILDWHEFEIDTLDDGPDLPVGEDGGDVDILKFFLDFFDRVALHYTH